MVQIVLNIADDQAPRVFDAVAKNYNYQEEIAFGNKKVPNPENKQDFTTRKIIEFLQDHVKSYEVSAAVEVARQTAAEASQEVSIT